MIPIGLAFADSTCIILIGLANGLRCFDYRPMASPSFFVGVSNRPWIESIHLVVVMAGIVTHFHYVFVIGFSYSSLSLSRKFTRIASLWQQLLWLQAHPEHCHGGNHWIENPPHLHLVVSSSGVRAQSLHRRAMQLLRQELSTQFLQMVAMKNAVLAIPDPCSSR